MQRNVDDDADRVKYKVPKVMVQNTANGPEERGVVKEVIADGAVAR